MSDMEKNQSAACDGDCTSCGSSCGFGESDATVTLTLDDDTTIECAVLTIYPAAESTLLCFLWMKTVKTRTERYICTALFRDPERNPCWKISKMTKNMRQLPMLSMNCLTKLSSTNW